MMKSIRHRSIRSWMIVVLVTAIILGAGVAARDWLRAHQRVLVAHNDYLNSLTLYQEGRASCLELAFRSRCLMDAECDMPYSPGARVSGISGHIRRLQTLRDEEARLSASELHYGRGSDTTDLEKLDAILVEARALTANRQ
jgi:hypothetical protein